MSPSLPRAAIALVPPGARDLTGEAVRRRRTLQRNALAVLEERGFEEVSPPTFEYEEIFVRAGGSGVIEKLIRFLDLDGRTLTLRYDFTASVARVAATAFADRPLPLRLCYSGKVYRQEPDRGARPREILQVGAELLGAGGLEADVELIRLAVRLATAVGLRDFQLNVGHIGALTPALTSLPEALRADVRRWIDRKDRGSLARALAPVDGDARALLSLPFVMGHRAALEAARGDAPVAARPSLDHLLAVDAMLTERERAHVVYDLGEVRGLDYYTGLQFELFAAGAGRAAGAGGRYDGLMERFGHPMPAVGLSFDLDAIAELAL
jgi:ATP phosphoribosyltransferase regulatory subunit